MKTILIIIALAALCGCVTKNPAYTGPNTNGIPAYIADPRIDSISNQVAAVKDAIKPANPYAGITDYVVNGAFGLVALISGAIARNKSKGEAAARAVADTIAAGAVKAGPTVVQSILDHASATDHFAPVASLINENTGANQSSTGQGKT